MRSTVYLRRDAFTDLPKDAWTHGYDEGPPATDAHYGQPLNDGFVGVFVDDDGGMNPSKTTYDIIAQDATEFSHGISIHPENETQVSFSVDIWIPHGLGAQNAQMGWTGYKDGKFIRTVYVSGFSGHAQGQQVNLPMWANASEFTDVDGVTAASIDLGHHIYVWDLKNAAGKKVKSGEYTVLVEVSYWPSMQYQRVSTSVKTGKKKAKVVLEQGNLIPYLEVEYIP